jgi:hypothetical protein
MIDDFSIASSQGNNAAEPEDWRGRPGRGPLELADGFAQLSQLLRSYKERVDGTISPHDQMFTGDKIDISPSVTRHSPSSRTRWRSRAGPPCLAYSTYRADTEGFSAC